MNGANGQKNRPGPAKVSAAFPIIPISITCSVCYRVRRALDEGPFRFLTGPFGAILEPEAQHRFLPPCAVA
jgi:hypothetical protein